VVIIKDCLTAIFALFLSHVHDLSLFWLRRCSRGHDHMVVWFITTYAISAYHHWRCEFRIILRRGILDTTFCDKVCQWLVTGGWFSPATSVSSTNKTDCHDITEILLKVASNTITPNPSAMKKCPHKRGELPWGGNLVVFHYLCAFNILACWHDLSPVFFYILFSWNILWKC
jgi:hypothetical protein